MIIVLANHPLDYEKKLVSELLLNYDPTIRPVLHKDDIVVVTFGISLHQIIDVVSVVAVAGMKEVLLSDNADIAQCNTVNAIRMRILCVQTLPMTPQSFSWRQTRSSLRTASQVQA